MSDVDLALILDPGDYLRRSGDTLVGDPGPKGAVIVKGTLTGTTTPLPPAPAPGDLWLLGTPVPTAAPDRGDGTPAQPGDAIVWDGTTWTNTGPVQGPQGAGVPVGGTTGQQIVKTGSGDYATAWQSKPAVDVRDYNVIGDGIANDTAALQAACDAVSNGQTLKTTPGATYLVNTEIQLRKDGAVYDFTGSTFIGPTGGVVNGGLITIGDRTTPAHIVHDVTVIGGHFRPRNVIDNGLNILCATRARCYDQTADLTVGQRGLAIQATNAFGGGSTPLKDIIVDGFFSFGGGVNGVNIDTTGGNLVSDVVIRDLVVLGAQIGVRLSAGTDAYRVDRAIVDNATLIACGTGITWHRTTESRISNVDILASTTRGVDARLAETNQWSNIRVSCASGDGIAITLGDENTLTGLTVKGGSFGALINSTDTVVNGATFINCTTALSTVDAMRTRWSNVVFENCTTMVNAWRDNDRYDNFAVRDATAVTPLVRPARVITADRTLDITDAGRVIEVNSASAVNVTFPPNATVAFPIGTEVVVYRHGAGTVTPVAGSGVVIRNLLAIPAQYGTVRFRKRGTDEWIQT